MRPDTYRESLAAAMPLIEYWRKMPCKEGDTKEATTVCPACGGTIRLFKESWRMSLTAHCNTAFCVQLTE